MPWRPARITGDHDLLHVTNQGFRETNGRIDDLEKSTSIKFQGGASLNFGTIGAQSCTERNVRVFNASRQGVAHVSPTNELGSTNLSWSSYVSAQHTVTVRLCNPTGAGITPNVILWKAFVNQ